MKIVVKVIKMANDSHDPRVVMMVNHLNHLMK
jgi:hypothetical protein